MCKDNEEYEECASDGFDFGNDKSKAQVVYEDIRSIIYNFIMVCFYKIRSTPVYRFIHIGFMILWAMISWTVALGQYDIKIMDGEDENVIFHLPSI